jgi:hypothetical protein
LEGKWMSKKYITFKHCWNYAVFDLHGTLENELNLEVGDFF